LQTNSTKENETKQIKIEMKLPQGVLVFVGGRKEKI